MNNLYNTVLGLCGLDFTEDPNSQGDRWKRGNSDLANISHPITPLSSDLSPHPAGTSNVLVLHHSAFEAGSDPRLPWGLFSARAIAEPTLGYQPRDKCSVTGYIFQRDGPASKDIVDL